LSCSSKPFKGIPSKRGGGIIISRTHPKNQIKTEQKKVVVSTPKPITV
jgi:hypothetical protein